MRVILLGGPAPAKVPRPTTSRNVMAFRRSLRATCCVRTSKRASELGVAAKRSWTRVAWCRRHHHGHGQGTHQDDDCKAGYLFDGFSTHHPAGRGAERAGVPIDAVVEIDVPDEEIIKRMSGRRVHLGSGRTYHVVFNPPKQEGIDDVTGEPLIQRDDDQEEIQGAPQGLPRPDRAADQLLQQRADAGNCKYVKIKRGWWCRRDPAARSSTALAAEFRYLLIRRTRPNPSRSGLLRSRCRV